jgi:hypothetical protein
MVLAASGASLSATTASAQAAVDEKDPTAVALGYVSDTTKADGKKYPKHDNAQHCDGCMLWVAKPGETTGDCALFAGKKVQAKGWCSAWSKKA